MNYREAIINMYLDYLNNYLSCSLFAEMNGLTFEQAEQIILLGRELINSNHPES